MSAAKLCLEAVEYNRYSVLVDTMCGYSYSYSRNVPYIYEH